jgi:hypothetical protein
VFCFELRAFTAALPGQPPTASSHHSHHISIFILYLAYTNEQMHIAGCDQKATQDPAKDEFITA